MASTVISWGLTLSLLVVGVYVYRPDLLINIAPASTVTKSASIDAPTKSTNKKSKSKKAAATNVAVKEESAGDSQANKKRKIVSAQTEQPVATGIPVEAKQSDTRTGGDGLSDKDFARQLAEAQSGTKLQAQTKHQEPSKKERRASKLAQTSHAESTGVLTEASSSTNGRDADDDLTLVDSPESRPADIAVSRAGDISDMLEAPAAKPTTLRLTDISNDKQQKKPSNKQFEQVLSKKKRNEQARKEEQRLAREESDRIHEAKKQEQLRNARMAAGTSNQTKAADFAAKANAWQSGTSSAVKTAPVAVSEPFLDTFEGAQATAGPAHGAVHTQDISSTNANDLKTQVGEDAATAMTASARREGLSKGQKQEYYQEVFEADYVKAPKQQLQEDPWESVTNKKSRKKSKSEAGSTSGRSSPALVPVPATTKPINTAKKTNGAQKKADTTTNRFESFQSNKLSGLQDAEWEA